MDANLLAQLTRSTTPMSAEDWAALLTDHATFLRHARPGSNGRWQVVDVAGLPLGIWEGPSSEQGKQLNLNLGNLSRLTLDGAQLEAAGMPGANATKVSFREANLRLALLADAQLEGCDFSKARLDLADFSRASCRGANFRGAMATDTDFENADLRDCDFTGATLVRPKLKGAQIAGAKGLPPEREWGA